MTKDEAYKEIKRLAAELVKTASEGGFPIFLACGSVEEARFVYAASGTSFQVSTLIGNGLYRAAEKVSEDASDYEQQVRAMAGVVADIIDQSITVIKPESEPDIEGSTPYYMPTEANAEEVEEPARELGPDFDRIPLPPGTFRGPKGGERIH